MTTASVTITRDLPFAQVDGHALTLDLYRPDVDHPVPAVVYLHGGGFQVGDKSDDVARLTGLAGCGIAVAAANYRLAPHHFPLPVHDAKAAVRWLRANARDHGLRAERVGVWGASAGGILAALVGLTANDAELEGDAGEHVDVSSEVQAVVAWYAPGDLLASSRRSKLEADVLPAPFEEALFGHPIGPGDPDAVRNSPVGRAHGAAPDFLIQSGDRDRIVSEADARSLHDALVRVGASSTFQVLGHAGHESDAFDQETNLSMVAAWLRGQLLRNEQS